jgi:nicotinate-nucleotide adenylyltransferase
MITGCLFGTFDPPHKGHLEVAAHTLREAGLHEVWLVVTPLSPFKTHRAISSDVHRMRMVELAVQDQPGLVACAQELQLPKPNYTTETLAVLRELHPQRRFQLIIGGDNLLALHRWKDIGTLLQHHRVLVYPRPGYAHAAEAPLAKHPSVQWLSALQFDISSTTVRERLERGADARDMVPDSVLAYAMEWRLYARTADLD